MAQPRARPNESRGPESRLNEYFIERNGISREVIQADICRYLGNDALVKPGNHEGRSGYFIRAYRNLTSGMITDLQNDSRRWEADRQHRQARGQDEEDYRSSTYHEQRMDTSYPPSTTYDPNAYVAPPSGYPPQQPLYGGAYTQPTEYQSVPAHSSAPTGYVQAPSRMPVTTYDSQGPQYIHAPNNGYSSYPDGSGAAAPRYTAYDRDHPDYQPGVSSGMSYPPTTAPDARHSPMDPRYSTEAPAYPRGQPNRPQPPPSDPHRRAR